MADPDSFDDMQFVGLTLNVIHEACRARCAELGMKIDFRQTDEHDELLAWIGKASEKSDAIVINPGRPGQAATARSQKYASALKVLAQQNKPVVEVHVDNIYRKGARITRPMHEAEGDMGFVCGFGKLSYILAINAIARRFDEKVAA